MWEKHACTKGSCLGCCQVQADGSPEDQVLQTYNEEAAQLFGHAPNSRERIIRRRPNMAWIERPVILVNNNKVDNQIYHDFIFENPRDEPMVEPVPEPEPVLADPVGVEVEIEEADAIINRHIENFRNQMVIPQVQDGQFNF